MRRGEGASGGGFHIWICFTEKCLEYLGPVDICCRVELQADRMPVAIEAMVFSDSYKHMGCLGGMRLQSFLTTDHFVYS